MIEEMGMALFSYNAVWEKKAAKRNGDGSFSKSKFQGMKAVKTIEKARGQQSEVSKASGRQQQSPASSRVRQAAEYVKQQPSLSGSSRVRQADESGRQQPSPVKRQSPADGVR